MRKLLTILLLMVSGVFAQDVFLFTSFRGNGETGVFLATSRDGKAWVPLNGNRPWIKPEHKGMLMRDPHLSLGPDGTWHLLWTWGWTRKESGGDLRMGHATSRDLVSWSAQEAIPVLANEPSARNVWAPESVWDPDRKEWIIFWATTIPGRFPGGEYGEDSGYNHRIYSMRSRDWKEFTPASAWFDPGFNSIDSTIVRDAGRWIMIFKDERKTPLQKRLRLAFSDRASGPFSGVTEPFSIDWVEGPSAIRIHDWWWIYFDHYAKPHYYGAVRTRDWKTFEDMSKQLTFPAGHRHGTVVRISEADSRRLEAVSR